MPGVPPVPARGGGLGGGGGDCSGGDGGWGGLGGGGLGITVQADWPVCPLVHWFAGQAVHCSELPLLYVFTGQAEYQTEV